MMVRALQSPAASLYSLSTTAGPVGLEVLTDLGENRLTRCHDAQSFYLFFTLSVEPRDFGSNLKCVCSWLNQDFLFDMLIVTQHSIVFELMLKKNTIIASKHIRI